MVLMLNQMFGIGIAHALQGGGAPASSSMGFVSCALSNLLSIPAIVTSRGSKTGHRPDRSRRPQNSQYPSTVAVCGSAETIRRLFAECYGPGSTP